MSAYDMAVSDDIYGHVDRYVSRARLLQMLDKEFSQVVARLAHLRPKNTTFFAYAATVTARSFKQKNECHGWVGIRLQLHPGAEPSDVIMHVRMLDNDNALQSEALGILGDAANKPLVVRLDGNNVEEGRRILAEANHPLVTEVGTMDAAADKAAELAFAGK